MLVDEGAVYRDVSFVQNTANVKTSKACNLAGFQFGPSRVKKFCLIPAYTTSEPALMTRSHMDPISLSQHITVSRYLISAALRTRNRVTTFVSLLVWRVSSLLSDLSSGVFR